MAKPAHQPAAMLSTSPVAASSRRRIARLSSPPTIASRAASQSVSNQSSLCPRERSHGSTATPCSHQRAKTSDIGRSRSARNRRGAVAASAVPAPPGAAQRNPMTNRQANP